MDRQGAEEEKAGNDAALGVAGATTIGTQIAGDAAADANMMPAPPKPPAGLPKKKKENAQATKKTPAQ